MGDAAWNDEKRAVDRINWEGPASSYDRLSTFRYPIYEGQVPEFYELVKMGVEPFGWDDAGTLLGAAGNALGLGVGFGMLLAPEPTFATKVIGTAVIGKSAVGTGLNIHNMIERFRPADERYEMPGSAARLAAGYLAPGSTDAERLADVVDLGIDLAAGRPRFFPYGRPALAGNRGFTAAAMDPIERIYWDANMVKAFQGLQYVQIVGDEVDRFFTETMGEDN